MKCKNYFFSLFVALLGVFFGSCIINQNNTYAVDDYSITINKNNVSLPYTLCGSNSGIDCSSYSYLSVSFSSVSPDAYLLLYFEQSGYYSRTQDFYAFSDYFVISLNFNSSNSRINISSASNYSNDVTYTFFNSLGGSTPSGSIELTENGTYDVSQYAEAVVNVPETDCPPSSGGGNYHEDLVAINNSILICAAVCLVIYFFYCIYRMIIKNSGVK